MILVLILSIVVVCVVEGTTTFSVINETFSTEYIFQNEYIGNYSDHVAFCRTQHNAELIKFDSNDEYEFIYELVKSYGGGYIIGLYIPSRADYRSLTWFDGTSVDLSRIPLRFRFGLPAYSTSFRYYYFRFNGDLVSANYYGNAICKKRLDASSGTSTVATTGESVTTIVTAASALPIQIGKCSLNTLNELLLLLSILIQILFVRCQ